ncbi:Uncharacterised protein [Vibrio cholerae]|nr:Uncharacterised protein [Vibrio cholerae]
MKTFADPLFFDRLNPHFEIDRHRCAANLGAFAVATYHVTDFDRFFKSDTGNRNSHDASTGDLFSENTAR